MANRFYNNSKVNGESFDAADVESIEAGFQGVQDELDAHDSEIDTHVANTSNPHSVTKAQVGLGNVDNTADADKPISTAAQAALDGKEASIGAKGTAFNKNFGTGAGTVCQGNDSRLSDSRTPTSHNHAISEVTDLQTTLDGKSSTSHNHDGTYEPVDANILRAGTSKNLTVGFTTDAESIGNVTSLTPDLTAEHVKLATVTGDLTINEPATTKAGFCVIRLLGSGGPWTVGLGSSQLKPIGNFPDIADGVYYEMKVVRYTDTYTTVEIVEIGA